MYNTRILVGIITTCIIGSKSDDNINIVTVASVPRDSGTKQDCLHTDVS